MRIVKKALLVAWLVSLVVLLGCTFLSSTGERAPDLIVGSAFGACCMTGGLLLLLVQVSSEHGSVFVGTWCCIECFALGIVALSLGGLLPDVFRLLGAGVFLSGLALMVLVFGMVNLADGQEAFQKDKANASVQPAGGWTTQQVALALMLFGVIAVLAALKCLAFGPPPYSVLAYVIGPCLIVASYLADPYAITDLLTDAFRSPKPPAAKGR